MTEQDWYNKAVMDKGATHALVTRSIPVSRHKPISPTRAGKQLAWVEENALTLRIPSALSRQPCKAERSAPWRDRTARRSITGCWRPSWLLESAIRSSSYVYGGPHGQQVTDDWYGAAAARGLVDKGWIVFTIDNRGTNRRGTKFESAIYRKMGDAEVADQLAGVRG